MTDAAITFSDLTLGYGNHPAIHHLSGVVRRGSLTGIIGANGSGKSTLMKGIAGLLKPMGGQVRVAGRIAYLPQQSEIDRTFPARVVDLVRMGLWPRRGLLGRISSDDRRIVAEAIESVGLGGFETRGLDTLSGGQFQRALFARVLVQDADIVLLDEPFNAVDSRTVTDLLGLVQKWQGDGLTVLVVAHDLELARANFPEALLLARRQVAWGPSSEVITPGKLAAARQFEEAWIEGAPWCEPEGGSGPAAHRHAPAYSHGDHHDHGDAPAPPRVAAAR